MQYTDNYKLRLPDEEDIYNVEDFNFNTEKVDEEFGNISKDIKDMKETFQGGVESTYSAVSSKGSTPTGKTLAEIADAILQIKMIKELPLMKLLNCSYSNNYMGKGFFNIEPYTYEYEDSGFGYVDASNSEINPYEHNYISTFRSTIRLKITQEDYNYLVNNTTISYYSINDGNYVNVLESNTDALPDILVIKDKSSKLKFRIFFDAYKEENDSWYRYSIGNPTYEKYDRAGCFDTYIQCSGNYVIYCIDIQKFYDRCEISLYNETYELLERRVYVYEDWLHSSIYYDNAHSFYTTLGTNIDIHNTFFYINNKILYGRDQLDTINKIPFEVKYTEYQKDDVGHFNDPYENIYPDYSPIEDSIDLLNAVENHETVGPDINYYWGTQEHGFMPEINIAKYSLSGTNSYGSWNVPHDILLNAVDFIYCRPVVTGYQYYDLTNGGKAHYIIIFNMIYFAQHVDSCIMGYMSEDNSTYNWSTCSRRQWCNTCFRELVTNIFGNIFKSFKCPTKDRNGNITYTDDYFVIPSKDEVDHFHRIYTLYKDYDSWTRDCGTENNQAIAFYTNNLTDRGIYSSQSANTSNYISNIIGVI